MLSIDSDGNGRGYNIEPAHDKIQLARFNVFYPICIVNVVNVFPMLLIKKTILFTGSDLSLFAAKHKQRDEREGAKKLAPANTGSERRARSCTHIEDAGG